MTPSPNASEPEKRGHAAKHFVGVRPHDSHSGWWAVDHYNGRGEWSSTCYATKGHPLTEDEARREARRLRKALKLTPRPRAEQERDE